MQMLEEKLEQKTDDRRHMTLLEQATMQIGDEMDSTLNEFSSNMSDPQERTKHIGRLHQKRGMIEIRPRMQDLQDDLTKEAARDIEKAVQDAQDDLHLNQGKLTRNTEKKIRLQSIIVTQNVKALKADLRKEAETLEAELQARCQDPQLNCDGQAPTTQPAPSPAREASRNPCQRASPVRPCHNDDTPNEDTWNQMVGKGKEKVTLTHSLPHNATDLTQTQAEAFCRQTESNFEGPPAVLLQKFEDLTRRGNSIPKEHAMEWPPECVEDCSAVLQEKLTESIPHMMHTTAVCNILTTHQRK
jgi:hypothetical protein